MISAEELLALGLGPDAISYRVHTGRLTVRFRGVYSIVSGELPPAVSVLTDSPQAWV